MDHAKYRKTELPDRTGPRSECAEGVNLPDMVPTVQIESYFAKMNFHTLNPHTQTFTHVRGWERLVCGVKPCVHAVLTWVRSHRMYLWTRRARGLVVMIVACQVMFNSRRAQLFLT